MSVQDISASGSHDGPAKVSLLYDPQVRAIVSQALLLIAVLWVGYEFVQNARLNLEKQNIASGFGFLSNTAGFGIIQSLIPYSEEMSYGRTFLVGLFNTLLVAVIGVILATILGFILGVARLSKNWVIAKLATVYVEIVRNIPLLLQIFFWYFAVLRAVPQKREKWSFFFDSVHLNIYGLWGPKPIFGPGSSFTVYALLIGIIISIVIATWSKKRQEATGQQFPVGWTSIGLILGLPLVAFFITGMPISLEPPEFVDTGPLLPP